MPNQEKVINQVNRVTYHDRPENLSMILLPNRELMQANFLPAPDNSFCWQVKQEWEWRGFQNGTSLENGWLRIHVRRSINCPGLHLRGRFPSEVVQGCPYGSP